MSQAKQKVFLVGASGIIGSAVLQLLHEQGYTVVTGGLEGADIALDLANPDSIAQAFKQLGAVDAVISTAGRAEFVTLEQITPAPLQQSRYGLGLLDKLMGQVNLALAAREYLSPKGCIVLTSGTTSDDPIVGGSSLSMVNGALEKWVQAAATELPAGLRINVVSPSIVIETPAPQRAAFPGFETIPASKVALAYWRCLASLITGQTLRVA